MTTDHQSSKEYETATSEHHEDLGDGLPATRATKDSGCGVATPDNQQVHEDNRHTTNPDSGEGAATGGQGNVPEDPSAPASIPSRTRDQW